MTDQWFRSCRTALHGDIGNNNATCKTIQEIHTRRGLVWNSDAQQLPYVQPFLKISLPWRTPRCLGHIDVDVMPNITKIVAVENGKWGWRSGNMTSSEPTTVFGAAPWKCSALFERLHSPHSGWLTYNRYIIRCAFWCITLHLLGFFHSSALYLPLPWFELSPGPCTTCVDHLVVRTRVRLRPIEVMCQLQKGE